MARVLHVPPIRRSDQNRDRRDDPNLISRRIKYSVPRVSRRVRHDNMTTRVKVVVD